MYKWLTLTIIFISAACLADNSPFTGTWQLQSGEYLDANKAVISYQSLGINSQKVISEKHFSFVSMANGKFWAAGTGSYNYSDHEYHESPQMASYPLEGDGTYTFKYKIQGDLWHNERWHDGIRVEYEVWKKITN